MSSPGIDLGEVETWKGQGDERSSPGALVGAEHHQPSTAGKWSYAQSAKQKSSEDQRTRVEPPAAVGLRFFSAAAGAASSAPLAQEPAPLRVVGVGEVTSRLLQRLFVVRRTSWARRRELILGVLSRTRG